MAGWWFRRELVSGHALRHAAKAGQVRGPPLRLEQGNPSGYSGNFPGPHFPLICSRYGTVSCIAWLLMSVPEVPVTVMV
jgi:hypothetical protein